MKKSDQLKAERKQKLDAQKGMIDTRNASDSKEFTPEERTSFNGLTDEIDALDTRIADAEKDERAEARVASMSGFPVGNPEKREKDKMVKRYSLHKALRSQLPGGSLDGVEAEYHQEAVKEARSFGGTLEGVAIPNETRADGQTVTQDSGSYGGNLVYEEFKGLIEALTPKPIVQSLGAQYMRGLSGTTAFTTDEGGIVASWEGEVDTTGATKNKYGKKILDPKRLSATVPISVQNIHQSVIDLEIFTANKIRKAIQYAIDLAAINGSGVDNVPQGILNASGTNVVEMGTNGAAPTWAKIIELATKVKENNVEGNFGYLFNPSTEGFLKSTLHTAGDSRYLMGGDGKVNGMNAAISNFMPSDLSKGTSTDLSAGIFGDFGQLLIAEWGYSDMVVDHITQKKMGMIEITVNQYLNMMLSQAAAFSVVKDLKLS